MPKKNEKTESQLLQEIIDKLDVLILMISLQGKEKEEKLRILSNYEGSISKRTLEKITGLDRRDF